MYFFWKYAQEYKIDKIVESGTYLGFSAKRLRKLFDCPITTFENDEENYENAKKVAGVEYRFGELKNNLDCINENTVVLIDGPKRKIATRLARKCLAAGALFVGIHDMYEYLDYLREKFVFVKHSGYPSKKVRALDFAVDNIRIHEKIYGTALVIVRDE